MSGLATRRLLLCVLGALVAVAAFFQAAPAGAVKAYPKTMVRLQPDGTPIGVRMVGDERVLFYEDEEGYTILRNRRGWWVYADANSHGASELAPTKLRVGLDRMPAHARKHARPFIDPSKFHIPWEQQNDGSIAELFRRSQSNSGIGTARAQSTSSPTAVPVLIILVDFNDTESRHTNGVDTPIAGEPDYQPVAGQSNTATTWQSLFDDRTVAGGLNHYYWEVSFGQFQWDVTVAQNGRGEDGSGTLVNDGWYINPQAMAYWGEDRSQGLNCYTDAAHNIKDLIEWAIAAADPDVDYAAYDTDNNGSISDAELMIFVIHARDGQENYGYGCDGSDPTNDHIWSHKWNIDTSVSVDGKTIPSGHVYSINPEFQPMLSWNGSTYDVVDKWFGVGVYAHEAFHTLGAPDLYDYDYDANVAGEWDLMDFGSYNGAKSGTHPSHMGTILKEDIPLTSSSSGYGWIPDAKIVDVHSLGDGVYSLQGLGGGSNDNVMHRFVCPSDSGEWFVLENRANVGYYDAYLPEHGVVVWHRDLSGTRDNWPYAAAVERTGWANTSAGLNSGTTGAAFSLDDGATEFTASTDPDNDLNNDASSGLDDIRCIGAEGSTMLYVYGSISGPNPGFAGATVSGGTDSDAFIDNDESATLTVSISNSSCAGTTANDVSLALAVAADSQIPASAVTISGSPASLGSIAAGNTTSADFTVTLACDPAGYAGKSITFEFTISGSNFSAVTGTFSRETDLDYAFFDDAEGGVSGWTSTQPFNPSSCASASGHGSWTWQTPSDRAHSGSRAYHTPEETSDTCYDNPSEVWVSPNISLPAGSDPMELRFWQAAAIPRSTYSRARIWVSTNNGSNWTRLDWYKDDGDLTWEEQRYSLAAFAGATQIKLLFTMYTYTCWPDSSGATEGWYIDDIGVVIAEQDSCSACDPPGAPTIDSIADESACAQSGIRVNYTGGSGASGHDLVRDGSVVVSDYVSGTLYNPGDTASHSYVVRAKDGSCTTDSDAEAATDVNQTPGTPAAPTVSDPDICAGSGVEISWGSVSQATAYDLRVDGSTIVAGVSSPYTRVPGDASSHTYEIRGRNATCTGAWSTATAATDRSDCICDAPPTFGGLASVAQLSGTTDCALRLSWSAGSSNCPNGTTLVYNVYRSTDSGFDPDPTPVTGNLIASCVTGTSFDDTTATPGTTYYYVVRAEDSTTFGGGPCNGGNEESNTTRVSGTVTVLTQSATQSGALAASSTTSTVNLSPATTVVTASSATLGYSLAYTPPTSTTTLFGPDDNPAGSGNWTLGGSNQSASHCGRSNNYAYINQDQYLTLNSGLVSTSGYTNIRVIFDWRTYYFEANDDLFLQYYNGSSWVASGWSGNATSAWACGQSVTLPTGAEGVAGFRIRFLCDGSRSNETCGIDYVSIVADGAGGSGNVTDNVRIELLGPGAGTWMVKDYGQTDPTPKPLDVLSEYNSSGGGPGTWQLRLSENAGGTATVTSAELEVVGTDCVQSSVEDVQFFTARATMGEVKLEWENPTGGGYDQAVVRFNTTTAGFPASPTDGDGGVTCAGQATGAGAYNACTHTGVADGTQVRYAIFVQDGAAFSPGRTVAATPFDTSGRVKWTYATGASAMSPPGIRPGAHGAGATYSVSNDRNLHAMNVTDAGGDWPRNAPFAWMPMSMNAPAQHRPPVVALGSDLWAFLASQDGYAYCVDARSGSQVWISNDGTDPLQLGGMLQANPVGLFSAFVPGAPDRVFVGTRDAAAANVVYALDSATGEALTSFANTTGQNPDGSGDIGIITGFTVDYAANRIIFTSRAKGSGSSNTVWCLDATTTPLQRVWSAAVGDVDGSPILNNGRVFVGNLAGEVVCLDASDGSEKWRFDAADGPVKAFVWPSFGTTRLYFSTSTTVWAIEYDPTALPSETAAEVWHVDSITNPSNPLLLFGTDTLMVGSGDGRLYQLDVTGSPPSTSTYVSLASGVALGSPTYDSVNQMIHIGSTAGILYAVQVPLS